VPEASRERWQSAGSGISNAVGGYVTGNILISLVAGTVTTFILLATGVPYPVPLGLVVAVFDLIPLVGATVGTVIVENHTLLPLVYHRTVQLSPLAIAVSAAAGAEIGGIVGALLGIPVAGALKVAFRELLAWRRGEPPQREAPYGRRPRAARNPAL
jgi:predicted PurR-regulated permease PerM